MSLAAPLAAARPACPYPGLRPFEADEWSIFFGRERMIDEVIERLGRDRLVMIHGASGSGKSSLVRAGVLPKLARQHLRHGAAWLTCAMRPSGGPLWSLAAEFARLEGRADDVERIGALAGRFNARGASLASVAASVDGLKGKSLCVLVDQFEELFRFEKETSREEAELFVDLIGRAATQEEGGGAPETVDVHVVVTMRSEFLGECARFAGLAETINRTQYLVPRLDDEAMTRAVRRPAQMYGGDIDEALADRLIASVRGREDELPLLQHGLMLMWEAAAARVAPGEAPALDGAIVDKAGGLAALLSNHADAVMASAAPDDRRAGFVETIFRELTDVGAEGSAIRRPRALGDLAEVAGASLDELRPILDAFRAPGASFLTPYAAAPLIATTRIDISHEALIRCWRRIAGSEDGWLRREFDDGLAWRSLLVEARAFARDKARILSPAASEERGGLGAARNEAWSRRYGGGWAQVAALLAASRKAATAARRRRGAAFAALAGLTLGALVLAGAALWERRQADEETAQALSQKAMAEAETAKAKEAGDLLSVVFTHVTHLQMVVTRSSGVEKTSAPSVPPAQDLFNKVLASAGAGNLTAANMVGVLYLQGLGTPMDAAKAREWFEKGAAAGDPSAMINLGWLYADGTGVAQDYAQAESWYKEAADQGNAIAENNLGDLYANGQGVAQDDNQALAYYRQSAGQGYAPAETSLGYFFERGRGVAQDYAQAVVWYRKGADQGNAIAQNNLGLLCMNGQGVARDYAQAMTLFLSSSDQGDAAAADNIGYLYAKGYGVAQNFATAMTWYRKAADLGNAVAQTDIGDLYANGQGVPQDYAQALSWYRKAADQGNAVAQSDVGYYYEKGRGVAQDYNQAAIWYRKAADQGNAIAQDNLGVLYMNGSGLAQDYAQAMAWLEKAAAQGNSAAQDNIGYLYATGHGVAQDFALAMAWYQKAASQNNALAQVDIGDLYAGGGGVKQDYAQALSWYRKAADQGNSDGEFKVGAAYENGQGVAADATQAIAWYRKAADLGNADAAAALKRLGADAADPSAPVKAK